MKRTIFNPLKTISATLLLVGSFFLLSCDENASTEKKNTDSVYSGLEGTREDASQLSNATIDTSSGQTIKKVDSSDQKENNSRRDSVPVK